MKVAVIGSRSIAAINLEQYLPEQTSVIITGGARGVDQVARKYATEHHIELIEFMPDYRRFGKGAPLRRNLQIIEKADCVIALWDGRSHGTAFVIEKCHELGTPCRIFILS